MPGKHWAGQGGGGLWRPQRTKRLELPGYSVELKPCGGAGRGAAVAVGTVPAAPMPALPPRRGLRTRLGVTGCQGPHSVPRGAWLSGRREPGNAVDKDTQGTQCRHDRGSQVYTDTPCHEHTPRASPQGHKPAPHNHTESLMSVSGPHPDGLPGTMSQTLGNHPMSVTGS